MSLPQKSDGFFVPPGKVRSWVDLGTVAVMTLWGGVLFLLPSFPEEADVRYPPVPSTMIATYAMSLESLPLSLRPDLVAMPSEVSFEPIETEKQPLSSVPLFISRAMPSAMPMQEDDDVIDGQAGSERILDLAASKAGQTDLPHPQWSSLSQALSLSEENWEAYIERSLETTRLAHDAVRSLSETNSRRMKEVEVWVSFDKKGRPTQVFLERGTENPDLDRELVRMLWNPNSWSQAKGHGRIIFHF